MSRETSLGTRCFPGSIGATEKIWKSFALFCVIRFFFLEFRNKNISKKLFKNKLYSNSYLFLDYLGKVVDKKELDVENLYSLETDEVLNVSKCVIALVESKQELQDLGIYLALQ